MRYGNPATILDSDNMYKHFFKRFLDFCLSLIALICLSPILLLITIWLHFANKGAGAFFVQPRPGKNGKVFHLYKFKSMTDEKNADGELLPDVERLTKIGRFVRSTSIDELPQLYNVLKGDMSFIGPRPLTIMYLAYYNEHERHRHDVRPGITGLAQVSGRTSVTWNQKFDLDLEYVKRLSPWLDLKIFFLTIYKVLKREGVGVDTSGTKDFDAMREQEWIAEGHPERIAEAHALTIKMEQEAGYIKVRKDFDL